MIPQLLHPGGKTPERGHELRACYSDIQRGIGNPVLLHVAKDKMENMSLSYYSWRVQSGALTPL